ncbi:translation initiation factor IF-2-like [Orcinus orca]|uniref:translation initiation factor IF-2-like n=1 Tax=Orcinus orca TaxID=9733 RepID=UPI0021113A4C|nr:translation initiation factor IF-2-like [Orcinus orca]
MATQNSTFRLNAKVAYRRPHTFQVLRQDLPPRNVRSGGASTRGTDQGLGQTRPPGVRHGRGLRPPARPAAAGLQPGGPSAAEGLRSAQAPRRRPRPCRAPASPRRTAGNKGGGPRPARAADERPRGPAGARRKQASVLPSPASRTPLPAGPAPARGPAEARRASRRRDPRRSPPGGLPDPLRAGAAPPAGGEGAPPWPVPRAAEERGREAEPGPSLQLGSADAHPAAARSASSPSAGATAALGPPSRNSSSRLLPPPPPPPGGARRAPARAGAAAEEPSRPLRAHHSARGAGGRRRGRVGRWGRGWGRAGRGRGRRGAGGPVPGSSRSPGICPPGAPRPRPLARTLVRCCLCLCSLPASAAGPTRKGRCPRPSAAGPALVPAVGRRPPRGRDFRIKRFLAKKQKQNRPILQWIPMKTGNKIRRGAHTGENWEEAGWDTASSLPTLS